MNRPRDRGVGPDPVADLGALPLARADGDAADEAFHVHDREGAVGRGGAAEVRLSICAAVGIRDRRHPAADLRVVRCLDELVEILRHPGTQPQLPFAQCLHRPILEWPRGREAHRRQPPCPSRLPPQRPRRSGRRAHRDRGQVPARRTGEPAAGLRRGARRRGVARRRAHPGVLAGQHREPRPRSRTASSCSSGARSTRSRERCASAV